MEDPFLILKSPSSKILQIFKPDSKDLSDIIFIRNTDGIQVVEISSKTTFLSSSIPMVIPNNDWSERLNCEYSSKLKALVCFNSQEKGLELYFKRDKYSSRGAGSKYQSIFKLKPKRFSLEGKIKSVEDGKVSFYDNESIFRIDDLLTVNADADYDMDGDDDNDGNGNHQDKFSSSDPFTDQQNLYSSESINEICKFLKINYNNGIFCKNLIKSKYLCYISHDSKITNSQSQLKMVNIDFQKVVFCEEIDSFGEEVVYCDDEFVVYSDGKNNCFIRKISEQSNLTLAKMLKKSSTAKNEDVSPEKIWADLKASLKSKKHLKRFLLGPFQSTEKSNFVSHFSKNIDLNAAFTVLNALFKHLETATFTGQHQTQNGLYFEELVNLISLIVDSKFMDLLLVRPEEIEQRFAGLLKAIEKQAIFFEKLSEVDSLVGDILQTKKFVQTEERRYGDMPAPWDEYSVQVLKF